MERFFHGSGAVHRSAARLREPTPGEGECSEQDRMSPEGDQARTAPVYDPATGAQTGEVVLASEADVDPIGGRVAGRLRRLARPPP